MILRKPIKKIKCIRFPLRILWVKNIYVVNKIKLTYCIKIICKKKNSLHFLHFGTSKVFAGLNVFMLKRGQEHGVVVRHVS